ncbi:MAG TPA: family 43 glycosylhydrolase, partial [Microbacteriaceae bacterium]|nr:family 43 glycosylhydrolase [Microbacteriaceae bacterium]
MDQLASRFRGDRHPALALDPFTQRCDSHGAPSDCFRKRARRYCRPSRCEPAILKDGDVYWMTYSSFEGAPGLALYRSTDLVNWTYECA